MQEEPRSLPGKVAVLVDFCEIDACPLLCAGGGHLQHPGRRVQALFQGRHPLDALQSNTHKAQEVLQQLLCVLL